MAFGDSGGRISIEEIKEKLGVLTHDLGMSTHTERRHQILYRLKQEKMNAMLSLAKVQRFLAEMDVMIAEYNLKAAAGEIEAFKMECCDPATPVRSDKLPSEPIDSTSQNRSSPMESALSHTKTYDTCISDPPPNENSHTININKGLEQPSAQVKDTLKNDAPIEINSPETTNEKVRTRKSSIKTKINEPSKTSTPKSKSNKSPKNDHQIISDESAKPKPSTSKSHSSRSTHKASEDDASKSKSGKASKSTSKKSPVVLNTPEPLFSHLTSMISCTKPDSSKAKHSTTSTISKPSTSKIIITVPKLTTQSSYKNVHAMPEVLKKYFESSAGAPSTSKSPSSGESISSEPSTSKIAQTDSINKRKKSSHSRKTDKKRQKTAPTNVIIAESVTHNKQVRMEASVQPTLIYQQSSNDRLNLNDYKSTTETVEQKICDTNKQNTPSTPKNKSLAEMIQHITLTLDNVEQTLLNTSLSPIRRPEHSTESVQTIPIKGKDRGTQKQVKTLCTSVQTDKITLTMQPIQTDQILATATQTKASHSQTKRITRAHIGTQVAMKSPTPSRHDEDTLVLGPVTSQADSHNSHSTAINLSKALQQIMAQKNEGTSRVLTQSPVLERIKVLVDEDSNGMEKGGVDIKTETEDAANTSTEVLVNGLYSDIVAAKAGGTGRDANTTTENANISIGTLWRILDEC